MDAVIEIDELLQIIFRFVSCNVVGYKAINLVCRRWYKLNDHTNRNKLMNHLWTLIERFPRANWDWWSISSNPNTTLKLIKYWGIEDENWNWYNITYNPSIKWDNEDKTGLPNDVPDNYYIYANPNINLEMILDGFKKQKNVIDISNFAMIISRNPSITTDFILTHMLPWNDEILSKNPNITLEFIKAAPNANWNWVVLSMNSAITWDIVCSSESLAWDMKLLAANPNITWNIITEAILPRLEVVGEAGEGVWEMISENPNITIEFMETHPQYPWHACGISRNPNLVMDSVVAQPTRYCFKCLSRNLFNKYEKKYNMLFY